MKYCILSLLLSFLDGNLSSAVDSKPVADSTYGVCKDDSNEASCTDETNLIQLGLQMSKKSRSIHDDQQGGERKSMLATMGTSLLQLPPAAQSRCASWFQPATDHFVSTGKEGDKWLKAVTEAGLNPKKISLFGQLIPKFTAEEVAALASLKGKAKKYRYNFMGSTCTKTKMATFFNLKGYYPARSKKWRRRWVMDFAKTHFSDPDFVNVTDAKSCHDYKAPIGSFDRSFGRTSEPLDSKSDPYFSVLALSNFTLCPGGDEPWSMRLYEAAAAGSMPVIKSRAEDLSPGVRGDLFGLAVQAVQDLFHTTDAENPTYSEALIEENRRTFIKYHTFLEGDNIPPGLDLEAEVLKVLHPSPDHVKMNRNKKRNLCIESYRRGLNEVRDGLGNALPASTFSVAKVSQKPLIIGAGLGSTGTRSLQAALKLLGKHTWHCTEQKGCNVPAVTGIMAPDNYLSLFGPKKREMTPNETNDCLNLLSTFDYTSLPKDVDNKDLDAIMDTPVAEVFLYLFESFPKAKVILTERNASQWVAGRKSKHHNAAFVPMQNPCGRFMEFPDHSKFSDTDLEQLFEMHSDFVRCLVPDNQLHVLNVFNTKNHTTSTKMMTKLAKFLEAPLPDGEGIEFPHVTGNETHKFLDKPVVLGEEENVEATGQSGARGKDLNGALRNSLEKDGGSKRS